MRRLSGKFRKLFRSARARARAALRSEPIRGPLAKRHLGANDPEKVRESVFRNLAALVPPAGGGPEARPDSVFPSAFVDEIVREADGVCAHEMRLFGRTYPLGERIDWHKDYLSGVRWPLDFYRDVKIIDLRDASDVKFPWELNRFHQAVTLGMAYRFTGDEKYTGEFLSQLDSWIEQNPPYRGVNWNCAMEAAIRAVNLLWAYAFFHGSPGLDDARHDTLLHLFHAHGERIYSDPENLGGRPGNHYLANLAGLACIACLFPVFSRSGRWRRFAVRELRKEMGRQVHEDGTNFEGSIPYHGLATEILFHAAYILGRFGRPERTPPVAARDILETSRELLGPAYTERLEKMLVYILGYTKPDGTFPQIGDNDGGRLVRLGRPAAGMNSHRQLLSLGGELFDREIFRSGAGRVFEETAWLFAAASPGPFPDNGTPSSAAFPDGGVYILRGGSDYLAIRCGPLGCGGKGTHNHNDNLAFELCAGGVTYLADPGTFSYSRDPGARNRFRSCRVHNTVSIDGIEQNGFSDGDMFVLVKNSEAMVLSWSSACGRDSFAGSVSYKMPGKGELAHVRRVEYDRQQGGWTVRDELSGDGNRALAWNFVLSPGIGAEFRDDAVVLRRAGETAGLLLTMDGPEGARRSIERAYFSPVYESRVETISLRITWEGALPVTSLMRIARLAPPFPEAGHR